MYECMYGRMYVWACSVYINIFLFLQLYERYLTVSNAVLRRICQDMSQELAAGCRLHQQRATFSTYSGSISRDTSKAQEGRTRARAKLPQDGSCLAMLDSFVNKLPTGNEEGLTYALQWSDANAKAVRAELLGSGCLKISNHEIDLKSPVMRSDQTMSFRQDRKSCLTPECGATELFDTLAGAMKVLLENSGDISLRARKHPIGISMGFPLEHIGTRSARIHCWTKVSVQNIS